MNAELETAAARLHVIAEAIDERRADVAAIAEPFLGTEREDVIMSIHEAERQLLVAVRALRRAVRTAER